MLKFNREINYEPSPELLRFWLFSRKHKYRLQLVTLPGLLQTRNFTLDTLGFVLVIGCELVGLANLMRVATNFKLIYAVGLFAADIVFALLYHLPKARKIRVANELLLTGDADRRETLQQSLVMGRILQYISATVIVGLAAFKAWGFYGLYGKGLDGLAFFIIMCYAVAATLHLICTGYFLFESFFLARVGLHRWFHRDESPRVRRSREFKTDKALKDYSVGPHFIKRTAGPGPDGMSSYIFEANGVLEDSDLQLFIQQQTNGLPERQLVATKGLELQMATIGITIVTSTYE